MASQSANSEGAELGRFLRARRTQTRPEHVGLTVGAGVRRTPGLRREELATLAGISIDYYVRLERGKETRKLELDPYSLLFSYEHQVRVEQH